MNKICLFSSYSPKSTIDNYIKYYLEVLKSHFDEVIMITNDREIIDSDIEFLNVIGVEIKKVKNEGLDFGMWYKVMMEIDLLNYEQVGFINDSCILFDSKQFGKIIEWVDKCDYDFCGITDSMEIEYHLQSYLTIAKGSILKEIIEYYKTNGIITSEDPWDVIKVYEIGLSQELISKGFKIGSYFESNINRNMSIFDAHTLISKGYPMVKKKLIFDTFRQDERVALANANFFPKNIGYRSLMSGRIKDGLSLEYLLYT